MHWYVVHTYASKEFKVKEAILRSIDGTGLEDKIGRILIPTQKTFHIRDGKKVEREKKLFTSYVIIEADLTPEVFSLIKRTPGVTNFLGRGKEPQKLTEKEVERLLGISKRDDKEKKEEYDYIVGDIVKIISGAFTDFEGVISKIDKEKKLLTVKVTVFGRVTPIKVKFDQIKSM